MKVTLFGATGKTGRYLIDQGLERGLDLTVVARSESNFDNPKVHILRGDIADPGLLRDAVGGANAVISALGPTRFPHPANMPVTRATQAIISAMQEQGIKRLIASSTGTAVDPDDRFQFKIWFPGLMIKYLVPGVYRDILGIAEAIRSSGLDWTLPRLAVLTNGQLTGRINVGIYGHVRHSLTISRADVAKFMLDQIEQRNLIRQAPGISGA